MKNTLTYTLCILCAIMLAAGAVCIGAYRGWNQEREEILNLSGDIQASASYEERGMDAANLAVVASRHLAADHPDLVSLRELSAFLLDDSLTAAQMDQKLTALAEALSTSLPQLDSVQQSVRDQVYVSTLTRALAQDTETSSAYAAKAADFNARLSAALTGRLAQALGVTPLDVP